MITGEKVILRPLRIEDLEYTLKWRNDLFIKSSTLSHPFPVTEELEKDWYAQLTGSRSNNIVPFTALSKEGGNVIGYFALTNINWISGIASVTGVIGERDNIGKGLGREATELIIRYAFDFLNLRKICGFALADHPAIKTWLETGAVMEGKQLEQYYADGKYHDVALFAWFRNKK